MKIHINLKFVFQETNLEDALTLSTKYFCGKIHTDVEMENECIMIRIL